MIILLIGCGIDSEIRTKDENTPILEEDTTSIKLTIGMDSAAEESYLIGSAISAIINKYLEGVEIKRVDNINTIAGLELLREGKIDMFFISAAIASDIYYGKGKYGLPQNKNIKLLSPLYSKVFQCIVMKNSGINKMSELRGKKIVVGLLNSENERLTTTLLEAQKILTKDIQLVYSGYKQAINDLVEGRIDCIAINTRLPTPIVSELSANHNIGLLTIDNKDVINNINKIDQYYEIKTIYPRIYTDVDEYILTSSTTALLVVRQDLNQELVYNLTKAIYSNISELKSIFPLDKEITITDIYNTFPIPLHPGAMKYYLERGLIK